MFQPRQQRVFLARESPNLQIFRFPEPCPLSLARLAIVIFSVNTANNMGKTVQNLRKGSKEPSSGELVPVD